MKFRSGYEVFAEKLFWMMLTGICSFGVKFLHDTSLTLQATQRTVAILTTEVANLNDKMGFIVTRVTEHDLEIRETKTRLKALEDRTARRRILEQMRNP